MTMQRGAYGFDLTLEIAGVDLTDTTAAKLVFDSPVSHTIREHAVDVDTDVNTSNKTVTYKVQQGDFVEAGLYRVQFIDISEDKFVPSAVIEIDVKPNVFPEE